MYPREFIWKAFWPLHVLLFWRWAGERQFAATPRPVWLWHVTAIAPPSRTRQARPLCRGWHGSRAAPSRKCTAPYLSNSKQTSQMMPKQHVHCTQIKEHVKLCKCTLTAAKQNIVQTDAWCLKVKCFVYSMNYIKLALLKSLLSIRNKMYST